MSLCLSKILEKVIKIRLIMFFSIHKIICDYQYGFKEKHSLIHSLLNVLSFSYDAIQKKHHLALLMDLKKKLSTLFLMKYCSKNYIIMVLFTIWLKVISPIETNLFLSIIIVRCLNLSILVFPKDLFWALYFFLFMLMISQMLHLVILGFLLMIRASYLVTPPSQILKKIVIWECWNCTTGALLIS